MKVDSLREAGVAISASQHISHPDFHNSTLNSLRPEIIAVPDWVFLVHPSEDERIHLTVNHEGPTIFSDVAHFYGRNFTDFIPGAIRSCVARTIRGISSSGTFAVGLAFL